MIMIRNKIKWVAPKPAVMLQRLVDHGVMAIMKWKVKSGVMMMMMMMSVVVFPGSNKLVHHGL